MIKVEHTNKTFSGKYGEVHALQDVSIHVEKGDIYGIIGFSGAGKSTLLRLVNGLVVFHIGIPCAVSNILGNLMGSHFALKKGARFIRPMMLVVLVLLLGKLISDAVL